MNFHSRHKGDLMKYNRKFYEIEDEIDWLVRRFFRKIAYRIGFINSGQLGVGPLKAGREAFNLLCCLAVGALAGLLIWLSIPQ